MASTNYVNNAEFLKSLIEYKKKCEEATNNKKELPQIPRYIGICILQIANKLATRGNFSGYTYKEDMIADGIENAIQAINNFDPEKSNNPFAYFTQIIWFAFLRRIDKEKKQQYIKHKVTENSVIHGMAVDKSSDDSGDAAYIDLNNESVNNFVKNFEDKIESKKQKTKLKSDNKNVIEQLYEE